MAGNLNSGRKSKETDQQMIEALSIYTDDVYRVLHENILEGKHWAIKIWFERMFGKASEYKDSTITNNEVPIFNLKEIFTFTP